MKSSDRILSKFVILIGFLAVFFSFPHPAAAFEGDNDGQVPAGEVINDDLIISYGEVIIDGTVNGNVFASAENVIVNGKINGNLLINGATAEINGEVNGSVAMAGQALTVNNTIEGTIYFAGAVLQIGPEGRVNRNILFTGYHLETQPGSQVAIDVSASGYQTIIAGEVGRDVTIDMGSADISGKMEGDVNAKIAAPGNSPDFSWLQAWMGVFNNYQLPKPRETGLRITTEAEINGSLSYQSPAEQVAAIQSQPGAGIIFDQMVTNVDQHIGSGIWVLTRLRELLTLLALGGLILWLAPQPFQKASTKLQEKPLPAAGWGFIALVGGYALGFVIFLTVIFLGVLLAIATLGGLAGVVFGLGFSGLSLTMIIFTLIVTYISKLVAAWAGTKWLLNRFFPGKINNNLVILLLGVTIYILLRAIPVVSILVGILATLMGLGAIWILIWEKKKMDMERTV
jgi:hypothetical protein